MKRVAIALLSTAISLAIVEGIARMSEESPPLLRGELTTPGTHRVRTAEFDVNVEVNAHGFVDGPWGEKRGPRVVVIGDSFVQAAQVPMESGFGRVLARELAVEVESMGVPGAGQATELEVLTRIALPRDPDLVVVGFLAANDILNNHPALDDKADKPFYRLEGGVLVPSDPLAQTGGPLWPFSAAWRRGYRAVAERRAAEANLGRGGGVPVELRVHDPHAPAVWNEAWDVTRALLDEMAGRCDAAGVPMIVLLFPDRTQVEGRSEWPGTDGWDFTGAQARAASISPVPTFDLLPAFRATAGDHYHPGDGHWNVSGHALAARAAAPFVSRHIQTKRGP